MSRPSWDYTNPAGMKLCGQCRTKLGPRCAPCSIDNPAGFVFCGQYGIPLAGSLPSWNFETTVPARRSVREVLPWR
jgi:hypothetical protein